MRSRVLSARLIELILIFLYLPFLYADCVETGPDSVESRGKDHRAIFGGCSPVALTMRAGHSNKSDGFLTIGALLPTHQSSDWEGGFSDEGLVLAVSVYNDGEIYDVGYMKRHGWTVFTSSWEFGLSYENSPDNRYGAYLAYSFVGLAQVRYLKGNSGGEVSLELGIKF